MIGKGAQYLKAAGFGRYRITAASLGSNLVFVGSVWLNGSAIQAIMDAFGVDGTAVIAATNEYLNGIAASDKAKATALAGFINEWVPQDGHCILNFVDIGKYRCLRNSQAGAYINTGYCPSSNTGFETQIKIRQTGTRNVLGSRPAWMSRALVLSNYTGHYSTGSLYFGSHAYEAKMNNITGIQKHSLKNGVYTNALGEQVTTSESFATTDRPMALFCGNLQDQGGFKEFGVLDMSYAIFYEGDTMVRWFIPWISNGVNGMIDILTETFYANLGSGTFSIVYEDADGTEWTPPTP